MSAALDRIVALFPDAKPAGNGRYKACCPCHADKNPSLSMSEGAGGRVLLHCFAGCTTEAVCAAKGITVKDLFARGDTFTHTPRPAPKVEAEPPRNLEREAEFAVNCRDDLSANEDALAYLWRRRGIGCKTASDWGIGVTDIRRDPAGAIIGATWTLPILSHVSPRSLIGVKLHRDPPRPGQKKGGWYTRGGAALFPLPEAQGLHAGAEIVLCEGELKALAYIEAALAATSPTTGAAMRWTPDMARRLAGLRVVIDGDRDEGQAAQDFVSNSARALSRVCRFVEVCHA
jgi:hypothetical protein